MGSRILEGIEPVRESRSYIDCLYSVLTAAGRFNGPKYMLAGMTGFAFIFVAHRDLIIASTEMYKLKTTGWNALNMLGYYSEVYDGLKTDATFPLYQKRAVQRIRESIDEGMAAIVWAPGVTDFGVITGYDDEDGVFFYKDCFRKETQVLLYENLGRVEASYWMCQVIGDRVDKDIRDIYMDSLEFAVDSWEMAYVEETVNRGEMASGRKAYEYLINALGRHDLSDMGAGKTIFYNMFTRKEACRYLEAVKEEIPDVYPAYLKYRELNEIYQEVGRHLPPRPAPRAEYRLDRVRQLPKLIGYCREALRVEEEAVGELKLLLKERLNNRYVDIYDVKKFR
jgi:hypothetical protein